MEENVEVKKFPSILVNIFFRFAGTSIFSLDLSKVQNSDNFGLNEAAPFVEEENLEEVGDESDELENYKFARCCLVLHVWSDQEEAGEEDAELEIDEEVRELMAV